MSELYKSLLGVQKELGGFKPDATNPHHKNDYISLDLILDTIKPLLNKHGFILYQEAKGDGQTISVYTTLMHESGENLTVGPLTLSPAKQNDPQAAGSAITYGKRYQLGALLGICETVDDDGNKASGTNKPNQSTPRPPAQQQPQTPQTKPLPAGWQNADEQDKAVASLKAIAKEKGFPTPKSLNEPMQACLGKRVYLDQLTADECMRFINFLSPLKVGA